MKAIIMAGGEGSRLRPLTINKPKPMVNVMNKPVILHIIDLLKTHNITDIGITLRYMPDIIMSYLGDGRKFGVNISYFIENVPLGTAGSVKNAQAFLEDTFVVISGDAICDINLTEAIDFHKQNSADATLILSRVDVPLEYGIVITDTNGNITRFVEKPNWSEVFSDTANTGIYVMNPYILNMFATGEMFDFSKDLFPLMLNQKLKLLGFVSSGYWCDIGDTSAYMRCHHDILSGRVNLKLSANEVAKGVWLEDGVNVNVNMLKPPVYIGSNSVIDANTHIEPFSTICSNVNIKDGVSINKSVILSNVCIEKNANIENATISDNVKIGENVKVLSDSIIGENTTIDRDSIIKQSIKIWNDKKIGSDMIISANLVTGSNYSKDLFSNGGLKGEINIDITPEFASKVGAAFGSVYSGGKIAVSRGDYNSSLMLCNSIISGLLSTGCEVYDFSQQLLPMTRQAISFYGLSGGIHISTSKEANSLTVYMDFISNEGANISSTDERKLESVFAREEFIRAEAQNIKSVVSLYNYKSYYMRDIINNIATKPLTFNILASTNSPMCEHLLKQITQEIKANINFTSMPDIGNSTHIEHFCRSVDSGNYDIGVIIDPKCETITLIDEKGRIVDSDAYTLLTSLITFKTQKGSTVYVPLSAPGVIEDFATKNDGKVERTKTSSVSLMSAILKGEKTCKTQFLLNFDSIGAILKILEFMNKTKYKLSTIIDALPAFFITHKEITCPTEAKGRVIRKIVDRNQDKRMELTDGVKIFTDTGWVLILPDERKAVCKIIAEGINEEYANALADFCIKEINDVKQ